MNTNQLTNGHDTDTDDEQPSETSDIPIDDFDTSLGQIRCDACGSHFSHAHSFVSHAERFMKLSPYDADYELLRKRARQHDENLNLEDYFVVEFRPFS